MVKKKLRSIISVANRADGMSQVHDRRFEAGDWPWRIEVRNAQADSWWRYFNAECGRRNWPSSGISQLDARENSGTQTVTADATSSSLELVWERKRDGPLRIRARVIGSAFPEDPGALFEIIDKQCNAGVLTAFYCWDKLEYEGLPWLGELWLNDELRLGPPSQIDQTALLGPRIIIVSASVTAIDRSDANTRFQVLLRELSVFLSVVLRKQVRLATSGRRTWTWTFGTNSSEIRNLGYTEPQPPITMPTRGDVRPVSTFAVIRPDLSTHGLFATDTELAVPNDIADVWQRYLALPEKLRTQFLQAGSLFQLAASLSDGFPTATFAFMVAACEALKPNEAEFRDHNVYDVVEALLDRQTAERLRHQARAQKVRNDQFHAGRFHGGEFEQLVFSSTFQDPSFREALWDIWRSASAALIEWLRRDGVIALRLHHVRRVGNVELGTALHSFWPLAVFSYL